MLQWRPAPRPRKNNSAPSAAARAFHLTPVVLVGGNALRPLGSNNNTALTRCNGYVVEGRGAANEQTAAICLRLAAEALRRLGDVQRLILNKSGSTRTF